MPDIISGLDVLSHLSNVGLKASTIDPYRGDFIHSRTTGEHRTQLPAVKAAGAEGSIAWISHSIQIWVHILKLESEIILQ